MKHHIDNKMYHIELMSPKQNTPTLDKDLETFADRYRAIVEAGYVACITDHPMGIISFSAIELMGELGLPVDREQVVIHLNTFHTKEDLDTRLGDYIRMGGHYVLVVSGDGTSRLHRLTPAEIGIGGETVTSVELVAYIRRTFGDALACGVAYNQYEPPAHEDEKLNRKIEAGARFIITQPALGRNERVLALRRYGVPVMVGVWMSKKLDLLEKCIGNPLGFSGVYDPIENMRQVLAACPDCGIYLSVLGYKTQFPKLKELWKV
jgi:methylenetetrahydrofolate reductase (NADPH)